MEGGKKNRGATGYLRRLARLSAFIALALLAHFLESLFDPLLTFLPVGAKLGLSNVIILLSLVFLGAADAYIVQVLRCVTAAFFSGFGALMYSLPAGILSLSAMVLIYKLLVPRVGLLTVSLAGAITHNAAQLAVFALVSGSPYVMSLLPLMAAVSAAAGLFVGAVSYYTVKYLPEKVYCDKAL